MHAETNDCCHVYHQLVSISNNLISDVLEHTSPTVTSAEPVFQPTSEN